MRVTRARRAGGDLPSNVYERAARSTLKKLDRLLLQSFVGPFLVAFAIALFVFLMQYLWVYIDEIIGKGAGLLLIAELVGYLSVSMMPLALPVAVLIAAVMTMGNLAEHYELSSMKSAGIPLLRVMLPLMIAGVGISAFSFVCSNHLIPVANLKARTRLFDIRKQKPSLSLEEEVFNDDFQGFSIRIGRKVDEGGRLEDVMLFRQGGNLRGRLESVTAERGVMRVTPDERYFILELEDGYQYREPETEQRGSRRSASFVRTRFGAYRKTFDLSEFEIDRTDESVFEQHESMLSVRQLAAAIDSIERKTAARRARTGIEIGRFITPLRRVDRLSQDSIDAAARDSVATVEALAFAEAQEAGRDVRPTPVPQTSPRPTPTGDAAVAGGRTAALEMLTAERFERRRGGAAAPVYRSDADLGIDSANVDYVRYLASRPAYKRVTYADRALQFVRSVRSYAQSGQRALNGQRSSEAHYRYERHLKYAMASACFVFLFVGAPLGAIIRKGGFGYPVLASIMLFALFIVLTIACKKLMRSLAVDPGFAAWLPTLVVFPIGLFLTYAAMNDRKFQVPAWLTDSTAARAVGAGWRRLRELTGFPTEERAEPAEGSRLAEAIRHAEEVARKRVDALEAAAEPSGAGSST